MLHVALHHRTTYRYDRAVGVGPQVIRLRPAPHCRTPILSYSLRVTPEAHFLNWQQDPQGNFLARVVVPEPTTVLQVEVDLIADMAVINPFDFFVEPSAETWPFRYTPQLQEELRPFLTPEPAGPALGAWLAAVPRDPQRTIDMLMGLNARLERDTAYVIRLEPGVQTCEQTLTSARGSCRDSAWLLVEILRNLGLAARFVSGYLIQLTADEKALDGPTGADADFTDLHAWAEVYVPGAGWIGLDATSGLLAGEGHIPLACSPKPSSAAPISGTLDACEVTFEHEMHVQRLRETPRVTLPYADATWDAINACGQAVDARLDALDVRLTLGGEPTFVAADDPDGAEWNTEAVGPTKKARAEALIRRLRDRFAPGGMLHYGQGKWYPGEPLPRWALSIYWREDGEPLWRDAARIATEGADHTPTLEDARGLMRGIAGRLGVDPDHALDAFEDPIPLLAAEQGLPVDVDPLDRTADWDDPLERDRLVRALERGIDKPVGIVLPVQPWQSAARRTWLSEVWPLRRGRLFLVPGDSPVGLRIPLSSLPLAGGEHPIDPRAVPFEKAPPLMPSDARRRALKTRLVAAAAAAVKSSATTRDGADGAGRGPGGDVDDDDGVTVRTVLTVEPRDGRLCVFLPPLPDAEAWTELVTVIEDTAAELDTAVHVEGYAPPPDHRLRFLKVTPDPGVIEVNVHPAASWDELVALTTGLYEDAYQSRLTAQKFMLDGRHTGTGGGNHVVLGAAVPADSPFLRRPDLLASLLRCWQRHPSLSYLFSGLFIGPTSQAPRVDEARHEALYELEIALAQLPERGADEAYPPWEVDRLLRDLLIDVTGNTHRTEICIDKLYSPDGPTGRLGLVELRGFEMPPHARMSLAQHLLVRALIARFWETPARGGLIRWGTTLHDRFMLPHYVWADLCEVLGDLRAAGYDLQDDWFRPHFEFRFPRYGGVQHLGVEMEIRHALEPWHVLGEDGVPGGTARYVDASVERLQVRVRGLRPERYGVACNGRALPLQPTGVAGEYVAGVRFRAWQPERCLHPTLSVDSPLTFDLVDRDAGRSVAGCTYHVAHPGGRNFESFPVNAYEAESRRLARFSRLGHTPGAFDWRPAQPSAEYPATLDLRTAGFDGRTHAPPGQRSS